MRLFLAEKLDSVATLPFSRFHGEAKLYVSHPDFTPANAEIAMLTNANAWLNAYKGILLNTIQITTSVHTTTSDIRPYLTYNKTTVPQNYALSFSITPSAATYGNILQYTQDGRNNGPARFMPGNLKIIPLTNSIAIWFLPEMRLQIRLNSTEGIDSTIALPLNQMSIVRIEAVGGEVRLFVNNAIDSIVFLSADRIYGDATLFVSNPWEDPATGTISPISMTSISQFSEKYWTHSTTSVIKPFLTFNKTTVPQNFSVSFDITPTGIVQYGHANILHYSRNGKKSGSSPLSTFQYVSDKSIDIYFYPDSLKLSVSVSTDKIFDTGISSSTIALPLKVATNVRVEAVGDEIRLFLNNSLDSNATVGNRVDNRVFGDSFLYVSNPWYYVANAAIGPISMYPISQFTKGVCKLGVAVESSKCNCPPGYTFDVTGTKCFTACKTNVIIDPATCKCPVTYKFDSAGTKCIPLCSFGNADPTGTKCQFSSGYWTHAITSDIKPSLTNNKTFLPQNFSISFDITPKSTREEYGNILHFANTNDGASMFGMNLTFTNN